MYIRSADQFGQRKHFHSADRCSDPWSSHGLTLTRTWNSISQLGALPMFGPNWISTYEEQVFPGSDGTMKYARADGTMWSFALYGNRRGGSLHDERT